MVRHWVLIPAFVGSIPTSPAIYNIGTKVQAIFRYDVARNYFCSLEPSLTLCLTTA